MRTIRDYLTAHGKAILAAIGTGVSETLAAGGEVTWKTLVLALIVGSGVLAWKNDPAAVDRIYGKSRRQ